jgi:hypothetical protein
MRASILFFLSALLLSLAFAGLGVFVQRGLQEFRAADRFVTVKGLAERNVQADIAIWPLPIAATANDLVAAQASIDESSAKTIAFLKAQGFGDDEIKIQKTEVTDLLAQEYRANEGTNLRYIIRQFIVVQTDKVDTVLKAQGQIGDLFKQGVVINSANQIQPRYVYNGLNGIKPEMIAEATKNARDGAEQFARDSNAVLGGIKNASQGQFQILPADSEFQYDEAQTPNKKIRVVTTVTYALQ